MRGRGREEEGLGGLFPDVSPSIPRILIVPQRAGGNLTAPSSDRIDSSARLAHSHLLRFSILLPSDILRIGDGDRSYLC